MLFFFPRAVLFCSGFAFFLMLKEHKHDFALQVFSLRDNLVAITSGSWEGGGLRKPLTSQQKTQLAARYIFEC